MVTRGSQIPWCWTHDTKIRPTLVGLTISKYKEQIVIYNNALSVHYTSIILQINSLVLSADDSRIKSFDFWALTQSANQALN